MISQKSSLNRANYSNVLHVLKNKKKMLKPFQLLLHKRDIHLIQTPNFQFIMPHTVRKARENLQTSRFLINPRFSNSVA